MAGLDDGIFREKPSPFLMEKLSELIRRYGDNSEPAKAISLQYLKSPLEYNETHETNPRHYEAEVEAGIGLERLYRRCVVINLTLICAAHCRYCLRANYKQTTLSNEQLVQAAKYCGNTENRDDLIEVLITGGDPLVIPKKLGYLLEAIEEHAPNIRIIRIGSRLPSHQPDRISSDVLNIFDAHQGLQFELGTQINHPIELFPETVEALKKISDKGVRIYSQNVLLKNINDNRDTLIELYDRMRLLHIEPHYLFHCVPIKGLHHFRTTVEKGINLIRSLTCSGSISGRTKPMFTAMTDIGKITFYEGTILTKDNKGRLLLQSNYSYQERKSWVPSYKLPESAEVDENDLIRVWYYDGED